jgi:Family of unknown function (DUF6515)
MSPARSVARSFTISGVIVSLMLFGLPDLDAQRRGDGGGGRARTNGSSVRQSRNVNQNVNVNRNVNVNQNVNVNRNVQGGYGSARPGGAVVSGEEGAAAVGRRGAVAVGEEGAAAVGPRGAVAAGEEGAIGVGRYGGTVVAGEERPYVGGPWGGVVYGERYESYEGWRAVAGVATGIAIGTMLARPPTAATTVVVSGTSYYYHDGAYYQQVMYSGQPSYQVVAAPAGAIITTLPAGCTSVRRGNVTYSQCGSTYYQRVSNGYQVVVF